jgi:hypothetical protein
MQGTVYRGALDMSSVWFRSRHQVMASAARRIWEYVMEYAIRVDPTLQNAPDDWYEVAIQAPRAPNVDVGRNSAAQLAELGSGVTTFDEIYGARGIDWRSALESKAQQAKHIRDLAIKYGIDVSEISTTQKVQIAPEPFDDVAEDSEGDRSENDNGDNNGNGSQRTNGNVLAVAPAKNRGKRRKKK